MKKKQLIHIIKTYHRELAKSSKDIHPGFGEEALHRFRVGFKKLRAFLRMIAGRPIKMRKKLKSAYHLAGTIRDLQLQRDRVLQATQAPPEKPGVYLDLLQREAGKQMTRLSAPFLRKAVDAGWKRWKRVVPHRFGSADARSFMQTKGLQLHAVIDSQNPDDNQLHEARKILKDLNYDQQILKKNDLEKPPALVKKDTSDKELLTELGNFQDTCRSLDFLTTHWLDDLDKREQQLLEKLKTSWREDKLKMKQQLIKQLQRTD